MYRILIVDDEEIIVNGMYDMLSNFDNLDLDVYKAYSGEEAIQWLARTRMDIVLTDIHMPEINGLQLLKEIKIRWPWCRVIFLTGHSEFDYAYRAIQYSEVRYLLKTEGYNKIIETIEMVIQELKDENQTNKLIQSAKDKINLAQDLFCQKYFYALLNKDPSLKIDDKEFGRLFIHLKSDVPVTLILGELWSFSESIDFWEKNQILYSVKQLIMRSFCVNLDCLVVPLKGDKIAIFIQTTKESESSGKVRDNLNVFLKGTLEVIQSASREKMDTLINFALAKDACEWNRVAEKYIILIDMLRYCMGQTVEMIIDELEFQKLRKRLVPVLDVYQNPKNAILQGLLYRDDLSDLYHFIESGEREKYIEVLEEWLKPLEEIQDKSDIIGSEVYYKLATFFVSCVNRAELAIEFERISDFHRIYNTDQFLSWKDATVYLMELSNQLFDLKKTEQNKRTNTIIQFVQEYIETHLSEDLSLTSLSEKTFLNPSYLSRLYHQTTGHKLSAFIEISRVKMAKGLLQNPNEKIYEIAKKVGYDTAASFTRLFKKSEGISPQEYRDTFIMKELKSKNMQ